jgi:flagellar basal-body rod protein FlgB
MSSELTIDAVRLALSVQEMQARVASINIANASRPDARALRADFAMAQGLLADAAGSPSAGLESQLAQAAADVRATTPDPTAREIHVDEQIGDMVVASTSYQGLSEALGRYFGLMRLAVTGRS